MTGHMGGQGKAPTKPKGWFSRRHETSGPNEAARERYGVRHGRHRRQLAALRRREQQLIRYQFGDFSPMKVREQDQERVIAQAQAEIATLRGRV